MTIVFDLQWFQANSGVIQTGSEAFDQVLTVLLQTSMLVGGILGCFLDNTIPGEDFGEYTCWEYEPEYVLKELTCMYVQNEVFISFPCCLSNKD